MTAIAPPEVAAVVIQNAADTARQLGAYFFGFASHANPLTYREHRPFRFGGVLAGRGDRVPRGAPALVPEGLHAADGRLLGVPAQRLPPSLCVV
ncbi:MAG: hypothetical protein M5U12_06540 [Verrucomicrobia bacterium]|nr:hypothetical protein [Verrucomicrobiota bacterium]